MQEKITPRVLSGVTVWHHIELEQHYYRAEDTLDMADIMDEEEDPEETEGEVHE